MVSSSYGLRLGILEPASGSNPGAAARRSRFAASLAKLDGAVAKERDLLADLDLERARGRGASRGSWSQRGHRLSVSPSEAALLTVRWTRDLLCPRRRIHSLIGIHQSVYVHQTHLLDNQAFLPKHLTMGTNGVVRAHRDSRHHRDAPAIHAEPNRGQLRQLKLEGSYPTLREALSRAVAPADRSRTGVWQTVYTPARDGQPAEPQNGQCDADSTFASCRAWDVGMMAATTRHDVSAPTKS